MRVTKVILFDAYKLLVTEHWDIKVSRRTKHIKLKKYGKRLVCGCTYHVNIDNLWKAMNNLLSVINTPIITDNADLLNALCNSDKISCIAGLCRECQKFKKLGKLVIENVSYIKKCMIDQVDCTAKTHTNKVNLFKWADYLHKGNKKRKIQLVEKNVSPKLFVLKEKLKGFLCHWCNVSHTNHTFDQAVVGISDKTIKIQDFSENYTCLLPEEIMSIHLTQKQATVYPAVVLRKVDGVLLEDH